MTKRKKKAALRQRLGDLLAGADGSNFNHTDGLIAPESLGRWLLAIKAVFFDDDAKHDWVVGPACMDHYVTLDSATDFLFERLNTKS